MAPQRSSAAMDGKHPKGFLSCVLLVALVPLIVSTVECSSPVTKHLTRVRRDLSSSEIEQINTGLQAGKEMLTFLESRQFSQALTKIASNISPYLGVIGPFVQFTLTFVPSESDELQYMKTMMRNIDNRFDQLDHRFNNVERLINWVGVNIDFAQIETNIEAMEEEFKLLYEAPAAARENRKVIFRNNYHNSYDNSGVRLYQAVTQTSGVFQQNFGNAVMRYTKNDRKKVQVFLKGIMKLLLQAAKIELTYYKIQNFNANQNFMVREWSDRIQEVKRTMVAIDDQVKENYLQQSESELLEFLAKYPPSDTNNEEFGRLFYNHLTTKYDWRDWFIVVYNPIAGWDNHCVSQCGGFIKFRQNGRNVVVASKEKSSPHINTDQALDNLMSIPTYGRDARDVWRDLNKSGVCSAIVIKTWQHAFTWSENFRTATSLFSNPDFEITVFG